VRFLDLNQIAALRELATVPPHELVGGTGTVFHIPLLLFMQSDRSP